MRRLMIAVAILLVFHANEGIDFGQQPSPSNQSTPSKHAVKMRRKLVSIGLGQRVTIRLQHGSDYHGSLVATDDNDFKIDEVDQRRLVTINYEDVKRVDRGYMQKSLIGGTRKNPHTSRIIAFAVVGGLAVLLLIGLTHLE